MMDLCSRKTVWGRFPYFGVKVEADASRGRSSNSSHLESWDILQGAMQYRSMFERKVDPKGAFIDTSGALLDQLSSSQPLSEAKLLCAEQIRQSKRDIGKGERGKVHRH